MLRSVLGRQNCPALILATICARTTKLSGFDFGHGGFCLFVLCLGVLPSGSDRIYICIARFVLDDKTGRH